MSTRIKLRDPPGETSASTQRRRPLLAMGLVGFAIGHALCGLATSLLTLYAIRLGTGIFSAIVTLPILTLSPMLQSLVSLREAIRFPATSTCCSVSPRQSSDMAVGRSSRA